METAVPSPYGAQNGTELYRGGPANGQHLTLAPQYDDSEDFGPETDVDMVDDVLLSPSIAAAKALVHGTDKLSSRLEDDLERQRQQLSDYDPADLDCSRDTPTPPAHEVVGNANAENLAESGGEESEEEWNYIPGKENKPEPVINTEDQDDMSSQLNPDAAEFVPVSPTRLLMLDDAIISASGYDKSLEKVTLPTAKEFDAEISQRPGDIEFTNGFKHGDDYFMRDNFSTLRNKGNFNSTVSNLTASVSENIPFDKLEEVQNMEEKNSSCVLEKANAFGIQNDFGATNIFGQGDPMTTSIIGLSSFPESDDVLMPETPKSTTVEAPGSPSNENLSPVNHETDLGSPTNYFAKSPELMSPVDGPQDFLVSGQERTSSSGFESESGPEEGETNGPDESNEGFITEHRRSPPIDLSFKPIQTFSDTNPFGALQTPSSTTPLNHFDVNTEALVKTEIKTPEKIVLVDSAVDNLDLLQNTPSSFISLRRSPGEGSPVPFDQLESPKDELQFTPLPNVNSSLAVSELPKSAGSENSFENVLHSIKPEPLESKYEETSFTTAIPETHQNVSSSISYVELDSTEDFLAQESKILQDEQECEHTSKLGDKIKAEVIDQIDTELEQTPKLGDEIKAEVIDQIKTESAEEEKVALANEVFDLTNDIVQLSNEFEADLTETQGKSVELPLQEEKKSVTPDCSTDIVEEVIAAFDNLKDDHEVENKLESSSMKDPEELEIKEMKLEFESHIENSNTTPEELINVDEGFEVISKDELTLDDKSSTETQKCEAVLPESDDQFCQIKQTNPFLSDDTSTETAPEPEKPKEEVPMMTETSTSVNNDLLSAIENFDAVMSEDLITTGPSTLLSSSQNIEPQATKTVSYQTLTPADEPKITKLETYVTGIEEEKADVSSLPNEIVSEVAQDTTIVEPEQIVDVVPIPLETEVVVEEHVLTKSDTAQSQVVTETLITALEEKSEIPSVTTTEVLSTAGTPPPTPAPGLDNNEDSSKTDILVAAVAAAGAVAAGSAVVADKVVKKSAAAPFKKPASVAAKKPGEAITKAPAKTVPGKPATTKPAAPKTTTTAAATKPTSTASTTKPLSATAPKQAVAPKPTTASTVGKKPTASAPAAKLASAKPTTTVASKPAVTTSPPVKQVPKQLSVNKTSTSVLKSSSKPTTPTSKPTTPTTPKSPSVMKADVKSPPRPAARSTLASKPASAATKTTTDKPADKKPLVNGDTKPIVKKTEDAVKKPTTTKSAPIARPAGTTGKVPPPANKTQTTASPKSALTQSKPKPTTTVPAKTGAPAPIKRPTSAPAPKTTGKETLIKQTSNTKPAVNGKAPSTKPASGIKKTDAKVNGKVLPPGKQPPIRKPVENKEENPTKIQEDNVTTTNGFSDHINEERQSLKIEELAPVIVEGVN